MSHMNVATTCLVAGVSYLAVVRSLRWKRYNAVHAKYGNKINSLTTADAQEVLDVALRWDMPLLFYYSLAFALFKTYAIPSISRILAATGELKSQETVAKRYSDTETMIATWMVCPVNGLTSDKGVDPRAMLALARTNWLHSRYNICNDDFLFTLGLFILEPITWAEKYGWRKLSPLEQQAQFVFWEDIGRRMNIKDIPDSLEAFKKWAKAYERKNMVPDVNNKIIADGTIQELLYPVPKFLGLKRLGKRLVAAATEDRVRIGMMLPEPPWYLRTFVNLLMYSIAFVQRHLMLPRLKPSAVVSREFPDIKEGEPVRLHPNRYVSRPWYKPESNGLGYVLDRLLVLLGIHADVPGPRLKSEGYIIHMQGPVQFEQDGHDEVIRKAEEMLKCPIPEAWKRSPA
ncbi:hypothetical protein AX14_003593 [Amanita brunnescens Koide BX004]|nr:hypothetical protein AX14_003593 [Amanita brunnescens Koide BX004]